MPNPLGDSPAAEANPLGDSVVDAGGVAVEDNPLGDAPAKGENGLPPGMSPEDAAFLKDLGRSGFRTEGSFQQKILEPAARGALEPSVKLPDIGEVPDITLPGSALSMSQAAGIYQGIKAIPEALSAPIGAVLVPLGMASAVSPIAKSIAAAAAAYFAGDLAKAGGAEAADAVAVLHDPDSTTQQKVASVTKAAGTLGLSGMIGAHAAKGVSRLGEQPVKIDVRQPDGTTAQVELPASEAAKQVNDHVTNIVTEAGKDLDSIYQQAGVERTPPVERAAEAGKNPLGDEPFVAATAEAVKPVEAAPIEPPAQPVVQFSVFPPEQHPDGRTIPGYVQVEERTNPQGQPMAEATKSQYPDQQAILDAGIPKGVYTLDEVNAQLAKAEPSGKFTISMKNAAVDAERVARGEEPILKQAAQGDQEIWDRATKAIEDNPGIADEIINERADSPSPLSAEQKAILFQRKIDLKNQFDDSTRLIDGGELAPEDLIIERDKRSRILDEMGSVEKVFKDSGGSEVGRSLRYSQMMANEDYTLSSLMARESAAKGRRLTVPEETKIALLSKELAESQAKLAEKEAELTAAQEAPRAPPKRNRIVQALSERADAARERIRARMASGQVSAGIDPAYIKDVAEIGAYHLARGIEKTAEWSAELVKEFGEKIVPHLAAIRAEAEKLHAARVSEETAASKLESAKTRKQGDIVKLQNKITMGELGPTSRNALPKDAEYNRLQARYEQLKAEADARLEKARFEKLSLLGKAREMALNTYDAARNIMTTGEFSFILRQGKFAALSHPILTAKTVPSAFRALFTDEVGARAIDLETFNQPEIPAARAAKLHLVEEGAKLSRQEEIFASKWAENIPLVRNFNQAGRVFLNKLRFDVWKTLRESVDATTPAQDAVLAKFVNEATGRGTLGGAEPAAVALGRAFFSPRYLASRVQLLVGHSMWGGDFTTRRIIAKEYAKALVGLGLYYTLLAQMKDKNGKPATIEKDPRSSDFGKVKIGNTRLDPLAGLSQVIVFAARTATLERKDAKGKVQSLQSGKFGAPKWSDVAANFVRSKLHPVPGAVINVFNGTDLGGNPATIQNQAMNMAMPLTYADIYQALEEQDLPEGVALSLLTMLGDGLQTYDTNRKRPKPTAPKK